MISESPEEQIVGIHTSGIELQEGINTSSGRNYCTKCKKKIHCYVKVDRATNEALVNVTCSSADCPCKCRTHYTCKNCGMLHPYGLNVCPKDDTRRVVNKKADAEIEEINVSWRELQAEKHTNMPHLKKYD